MTVGMVSTLRQVVSCDAGCNVTYLGGHDRAARPSANQNGWRTIDGLDYCPTHVPRPNKKKAA